MAKYAKGASLEREVARRLEALGWRVVRSAGSRGPADLVAWKDGHAMLIQCKAGRASMKKLEAEALALWARDLGARAFLASRPGRGVLAFWQVWPEVLAPTWQALEEVAGHDRVAV